MALEVIRDSKGPLRIPELARAVGTGVRNLEYAFRRHFDATPKQLLTAHRFHGARRELLEAHAVDASVTAIALRWGFRHLGRFSTEYRRWFDELPSESLRSTAPQPGRRLPLAEFRNGDGL